jgi:hypothetical protein
MKPKLMVKDRGMEKHGLMLFFPDDNPERQLQGCLNKNTLALNNASCYVYYNMIKEKKAYKLEVKDHNNKLLESKSFKDNDEESIDRPHFNINDLLIKVISEKE